MTNGLISTVERIDDIPLLLAQMDKIQLATLLDKHFPMHGHWKGLGLGHIVQVWLAYILSEGEHRLSHVESWAGGLLITLEKCLARPVRSLDFTDDRLAIVLDSLGEDDDFEAFERTLNQGIIRVYDLKTKRVRVDSTSASGYMTVTENGLFQFGHSKDHRPDLPQLKINQSALDPLGIPLTTTIVSGEKADAPLYIPEIRKVQNSLTEHGVLYVGDCKMASLATRAYVAHSDDFYLCPLSAVQIPESEMLLLLEKIWSNEQTLTSIYRPAVGEDDSPEHIAEGYGYTIHLKSDESGTNFSWDERRFVIRSLIMAREINDWLPQGIQSIVDGSYNPRCLKRYYFSDEVVDQLHPSDRILQHILLKQLKPTFKHVMNPNCYHLDGPTGVKYATQRIKQVLQDEKPNYVVRADIKSFYASIPHFKLVQDVKKYYHDPKLHVMLENIITNPIDMPRGYKNPSQGIALRGPLSQFFSGIYLKPLDDALSKMDVHYLRFQDDILIFAKTKRQLSRCRRRMMDVLHERRLSLSRKKSRMGAICGGFHFLGIDYLPTRTEDNTNMTHINDAAITPANNVHYLNENGGGVRQNFEHQTCELIRMAPHPRTLRKAREQVKYMVIDGSSAYRIRNYLHRWVMWWTNTSITWQYQELLQHFINASWHEQATAYATTLSCRQQLRLLHTGSADELGLAA